MALLERCLELFKTSNLYEIFGIKPDAAEGDLRRGYYKVSLKVHPDRAPEDPQATEKFQVLGKVYAVLSDQEQRAVYDEQGLVDEQPELQDRCWEDHWRMLFPQITIQDIVDFEKKYKGSEEEKNDVIQLYLRHQGNMDTITASVLCFTRKDEPRICSIIQAAIDGGEVKEFAAFTQESSKKKKARRRRADREQREAEETQKEMGLGQEDSSLVMTLQQRQKSREKQFNSFLSDLEAKYSRTSARPKRGKK